jgi:hypothetical protein
LTVLELQNKLPKARIIYSLASGASKPRNMSYMARLGLWGQGVASPRGESEIQQAMEEQFHKAASGDEGIGDVGNNPVNETSSLASVTLPPPSYKLDIKETIDSLSLLQLDIIRYAFKQHE